MLVVALPERLHRGQHFAHVGAAAFLRHAAGHAVEFELVGTAADAELQSAIAEDIAECGLGGRPNRMPVRRHDDGGAQPDRFGVRRPMGQD